MRLSLDLSACPKDNEQPLSMAIADHGSATALRSASSSARGPVLIARFASTRPSMSRRFDSLDSASILNVPASSRAASFLARRHQRCPQPLQLGLSLRRLRLQRLDQPSLLFCGS